MDLSPVPAKGITSQSTVEIWIDWRGILFSYQDISIPRPLRNARRTNYYPDFPSGIMTLDLPDTGIQPVQRHAAHLDIEGTVVVVWTLKSFGSYVRSAVLVGQFLVPIWGIIQNLDILKLAIVYVLSFVYWKKIEEQTRALKYLFYIGPFLHDFAKSNPFPLSADKDSRVGNSRLCGLSFMSDHATLAAFFVFSLLTGFRQSHRGSSGASPIVRQAWPGAAQRPSRAVDPQHWIRRVRRTDAGFHLNQGLAR